MTFRDPLTDDQDDTIRAAVTAAAHGSMITRYVVIAETIDPDSGEQLIEDISPDRQPIWDTLGLIDFTRAVMHASVARGSLDDDEPHQ